MAVYVLRRGLGWYLARNTPTQRLHRPTRVTWEGCIYQLSYLHCLLCENVHVCTRINLLLPCNFPVMRLTGMGLKIMCMAAWLAYFIPDSLSIAFCHCIAGFTSWPAACKMTHAACNMLNCKERWLKCHLCLACHATVYQLPVIGLQVVHQCPCQTWSRQPATHCRHMRNRLGIAPLTHKWQQ